MTIFGLGNPGTRYAQTRHNIGFMTLDTLARRLGVKFHHQPGRFLSRARCGESELILVKPLLYMNESGVVVKEQLTTQPDEFLVVVDDLALPFGMLRLRPKGSDGGHKGLASIIYHLNRNDFPRLRIGIGAPQGMDAVQYVLSPFTPEETKLLPEILERAANACISVVTDGLQKAMNRINAPAPCELTRQTSSTEGL
ncbi:aminoacyl-tRNA hydrolase [candidate division WOR-3 bacterium]|nr:aminoacyl-tRNA hydrolase [candidate division WOR-3 bacterium]